MAKRILPSRMYRLPSGEEVYTAWWLDRKRTKYITCGRLADKKTCVRLYISVEQMKQAELVPIQDETWCIAPIIRERAGGKQWSMRIPCF